MSFLKIGGRTENGLAKGVSVDYNGRFIPSNVYQAILTGDTPTILDNERKKIKSKYIDSELSLENDISDWTRNANGTIETDSIIKEDGDYSIKFSTSEYTNFFNAYVEFANPMDFTDYSHVRLWMQVDDVDITDRIVFMFMCNDPEDYFYISARAFYTRKFSETTEITLSKSVFSTHGSPSWSDVHKLCIQMRSTENHSMVVRMQNIRMVKQKPKNGKMILRFDDGLSSVYDLAMPILRGYGVPATCHVLPEYSLSGQRSEAPSYGGTESMSLEELKYLHSLGWTISSHTWMHKGFGSDANGHYCQAFNDLKATQAWLINNGFGGGYRSHVFGNHSRTIETEKASQDIFVVDSNSDGYGDTLDTLPWGGNSIIHTYCDEMTLDQLKDLVDKTASEKRLCIPFFHRFKNTESDTTEMYIETFKEFIKYGVHKDNFDFMTMDDLLDCTSVAMR